MDNKQQLYKELVDKAISARGGSYCPYSGFAVGSALLAESGEVYLGANIENASYTPTLCAERVSFAKAISDGQRRFSAIAIVGGRADEEISAFCPPCGVCRQFMTEFADSDFDIILSDGEDIKVYKLGEIMPLSFAKDNL